MNTFEYGAGGIQIIGFSQEDDFNASVVLSQQVVGGSVSTGASADMFVETAAQTDIIPSATVFTAPSPIYPSAPISLSLAPSSSANVVFDAQTGQLSLTNQVSGTAVVYADGPTGRKNVTAQLNYVDGGEARTMVRWRNVAQDGLTGGESLAYHTNKTILDALEASLLAHTYDGSTAWKNTVRKPWSVNNYDPNTPNAVPNSTRWFAGFDLSCMSCAQSNPVGIPNHPAVLIGPRHCVTILHGTSTPVGYAADGKCTWRGNDGGYYSANIIRRQNLGLITTPNAVDLAVCYLDAAISAQVTPAKYFPTGFEVYFPSLSMASQGSTSNDPTKVIGRMLVASKQARDGDYLNVQECNVLHGPKPEIGTLTATTLIYLNYVTEGETARKFSDPVIPGDSGSPIFCWVNGETVLLSMHSFTGSAWVHSQFINEITTAMQAGAQVAGDPAFASYAPQVVSLAGFKSTWP